MHYSALPWVSSLLVKESFWILLPWTPIGLCLLLSASFSSFSQHSGTFSASNTLSLSRVTATQSYSQADSRSNNAALAPPSNPRALSHAAPSILPDSSSPYPHIPACTYPMPSWSRQTEFIAIPQLREALNSKLSSCFALAFLPPFPSIHHTSSLLFSPQCSFLQFHTTSCTLSGLSENRSLSCQARSKPLFLEACSHSFFNLLFSWSWCYRPCSVLLPRFALISWISSLASLPPQPSLSQPLILKSTALARSSIQETAKTKPVHFRTPYLKAGLKSTQQNLSHFSSAQSLCFASLHCL